MRFAQTMDDIEQAKQSIKEAIELGLESVDKEIFERIEVDRRLDGFDDAKDHSLRVAISGRGRLDVERLLTGVSDSAKDIKGFKSLSVDPKLFADSWSFEPNRAALTQYGLELSNLSLQIRGYVAESKLHQLRWDGENVNVYSYIALGDRLDFDQLSSLPVIIGEGQIAQLSTFGSWKKTRALKRIDRENVERVVAVEVSYLADQTKKEVFQADLEKALEPLALKFPMLKFQVEDADRQASKNKSSMSQSLIYAIAMILFILALTLSSIIQPLLIGLAIPFGSIGVIAAFALHDKAIDIMAMVGVIGMAGVVVNDSLILVDAINRKLANGEGRQGLIDASVSRLRPILLTSITTLGGVFPMAYGLGGDSGFTKPLALSMGWGLVFATFLTLFLIPAMVSIQRDWRSSLAKRLKRI
ncbi:MAG: efflux RND transporter permease subunit [bacterium]